MLMYANCNDTPVVLHRHTHTHNSWWQCCFEANGVCKRLLWGWLSWQNLEWNELRPQQTEEHQAKTIYLTGFFLLCVCLCPGLPFAISFSPMSSSLKREVYTLELLNYVIYRIFFSAPSFTIYKELHTWDIKSMLFIKSIFLSSLAVFWSHLLFVFTSLPFQLDLFLLTLLGLVLFSSLSPPLLSSYLVSLPLSPTLQRAWQIVSVHETR